MKLCASNHCAVLLCPTVRRHLASLAAQDERDNGETVEYIGEGGLSPRTQKQVRFKNRTRFVLRRVYRHVRERCQNIYEYVAVRGVHGYVRILF